MKPNIFKRALCLAVVGFGFAGSAWGQGLVFTVLPKPSASATGNIAWGIDGTNVVGSYTDGAGSHGYCYTGDVYVPLNCPGATGAGISPRGMSGNRVIGVGFAGEGTVSAGGFLYNINTRECCTLQDALGRGGVFGMGMDGAMVVGYVNDATGSHGVISTNSGRTWAALGVPAANQHTFPQGISGSLVAGYFIDNNGLTNGFVYNRTAGTYRTVAAPLGTKGTVVRGISGNWMAGYYIDGAGNHGFLFDGTNYTTLNYPRKTNTCLLGISGNQAVGYYTDAAGNHAFMVDVSALTTTALLAPVAKIVHGGAAVWTAILSQPVSVGSVQFQTNGVSCGLEVPVCNGQATFTNRALKAGVYQITAVYNGPAGLVSAISAPMAQVVCPGPVRMAAGDTANSQAYDGAPNALRAVSPSVLRGGQTADAGAVKRATDGEAANLAAN